MLTGSKDNLELSDDSDIEVHPNVDKRSFIRAKQSQIHQERMQRKHHIETLKYEQVINDGLLKRISSLLAALKAHAHEAATRNPGEVAFQAVMESAGKPEDDKPPPRPEGVHPPEGEGELPSYSKMMATLLDQCNKALDEKKVENRYEGMMEEVKGHEDKVSKLQEELKIKLAELEKEDKKKITSESYKDGFNSSHVAKAKAEEKKDEPSTQVELLNPGFNPSGPGVDKSQTVSANDDDEVEASPDGKRFAQIKPTDLTASAQFLSQHPHILTEKEQDGILVLAFDAALEQKDEYARQCVHQALLLQYCRSLGRDGVGLFFKRITTKGHQAQEVFYKDVQDTYMRIRNRSREIIRERAAEEEAGGVEQIQLHAMEPGTVINIRIPPKDDESEEGKMAREIFEGFSPKMKKALESESLDEVNKVLGDMKVPEAEDYVEKFGQVSSNILVLSGRIEANASQAGILSLEEEIIDATTAEGQQQLKEMEKQAAEEKAAEAAEHKKGEAEEVKYEDPE